MMTKHSVLLGIIASIILLIIATLHYPGGSQHDMNSVGYDWQHNYISNLFGEKSYNGLESGSRYWAAAAMVLFSISLGIFFFNFSKRIPLKGPANVIKYFGAGGMIFSALIATSYHDQMITVASTMFLLSLFYITVFVFKTRLHLFKILCVICLLFFYGALYLFGSGNFLEYLPVVQKVTFLSVIIVILALHYFTSATDFEHIKSTKSKSQK